MIRKLKQLTMAALVSGATLLPAYAAATTTPMDAGRMNRTIRKELLTMPFLTIFDNLSYRVEGDTVHLYGQVTRPTLKSQAEKRVAQLEGITRVDNQIEVLPLSPFDNQIRVAVARAVYGQSSMNRYALGANPSIRIIVKNGNVALEGVVADTGARNIANIMANSVFGVFSVTNNLQIEK